MKKSHVFIFILTIITFTFPQYVCALGPPYWVHPIHPDKSLSTLFNESSCVVMGNIESSRKTGETDEVYQYEATVIVEEYLRGNGPDKILERARVVCLVC